MVNDEWRFLPLTDLSYQILLVLANGPLHGYGVLQSIADRTDGRLEPDTGTLYTAIRRLCRDELIAVATSKSSGARGRTYRLTPVGLRVVRLESLRLANLVKEARRLNLLKTGGG